MKIGIMSDTHGNLRLMHQVLDRMVSELGVEAVFHAGDDYIDAETLAGSVQSVYKVPGLSCAEYRDARVPNGIRESVDGLTISMAHADKDLRARDLAASIVITGHTHVARIEKAGRSVYLNPGHLKSPMDRGERASFAVVNTDDAIVHVAIYETTGIVRTELTVPRTALA